MATPHPLPPSPPPPRIAAEGLTRRFGARVAVDAVSFEVSRGEVFGFLGPNGAGKTTLFHLLSGLLAPDAGTMFLDGLAASPIRPSVRARYGVVFQEPSLDEKLTGRENLVLGAALHRVPRAKAKSRVESLLAMMELSDRGNEAVGKWSGGMKRRLELARAFIHDPEILVMDEPTQGLDQASFQVIWKHVLERTRTKGMTVLLTTHRPEEAEHCDRIAVLDQGKVVACDTPEALKKRVGGDVVTLEAEDPERLAEEVAERFDVRPSVVEGRVSLEMARGHELIPRLVEAFPAHRLKSVSLRRPTLGDAFLKLTGKGLAERDSAEASS